MSDDAYTAEERAKADRIKVICEDVYRTIQRHDKSEHTAMTVMVMLMGSLIGNFPPETWEVVLLEMTDIIRCNLRKQAH